MRLLQLVRDVSHLYGVTRHQSPVTQLLEHSTRKTQDSDFLPPLVNIFSYSFRASQLWHSITATLMKLSKNVEYKFVELLPVNKMRSQ